MSTTWLWANCGHHSFIQTALFSMGYDRLEDPYRSSAPGRGALYCSTTASTSSNQPIMFVQMRSYSVGGQVVIKHFGLAAMTRRKPALQRFTMWTFPFIRSICFTSAWKKGAYEWVFQSSRNHFRFGQDWPAMGFWVQSECCQSYM